MDLVYFVIDTSDLAGNVFYINANALHPVVDTLNLVADILHPAVDALNVVANVLHVTVDILHLPLDARHSIIRAVRDL
jgi:hypothetical protein